MQLKLMLVFLMAVQCAGCSASIQAFGGFEAGDGSDVAAASATIQSAVVHSGSYALKANPSGSGTNYALCYGYNSSCAISTTGMSLSTLYCSFYLDYTTKPASTDEEIFEVVDTTGSTTKFALRLSSAGVLNGYNSAATKTAGSTTLSASTWYRIDVQCNTGSSGASFVVKLNGTTEISGTGNLGTNNAAGIALGKRVNQNSQSYTAYFDDWCIDSAAYPGAQQTIAMIAGGAGTYQTGSAVGGAGSNWQSTTQVPTDGDTTYVLSDGSSGDGETEDIETTTAAGITAGSTVNAVVGLVVVKRNSGTTNG